ncbi:MAG TPA: polysaccharide biosynthesis tyrosine autokinase [Bacteroidales bacterium]|jgi:capsular exopolysaccharide synthesis family protein|nr:polysaccharide biosynthesis tyrosine autokinase [Bacteroidales bacterium]
MSPLQNINVQEETDLKKVFNLLLKNYRFFIASVIITLSLAFIINRYSVPIYSISSSILIRENRQQQSMSGSADFINSNLFNSNQNFQNELWVMKSYPIIEKTIRKLDLSISYYGKGKFNYYEEYQNVPFKISYLRNHPQPINVKFDISFSKDGNFEISAKGKKTSFYNFETNEITHHKEKWAFAKTGKFGELIETQDLAFVVEPMDTARNEIDPRITYAFDFKTINSISNSVKGRLTFTIADREATVIKINLNSESISKGIDIVNELMNTYSEQNLEQKNHLASITIEYIEKQLNEISDSLNQTEDNLQNFRSSRQLLNITDQASGISAQYLDLQNQLAELVSRKRYYDYVSDLLKNDNFSNMMLPASIGISDQLLNSLMTELVRAQATRSNLIENNQERNPQVQRLGIQIENLKKTITDNISAVAKTTDISIDEMKKRILRIENEISRLPETQRQLGNIERRYRLNDAIYNYLMEKHAEAKIAKASNLPDNVVIEPAKLQKTTPISPAKQLNYLIAILLGLVIPFGFLMLKNFLNNKIQSQDDIERLTDFPILGKILHNRYKTENVMFEFPKSNISESFRALRTNLEFFVKGDHKKVIMISSCLEGEGKSFIAKNLAMSYAHLDRKCILLDFDMRKQKIYFDEQETTRHGLSSYLIDKVDFKSIIMKSPHEKLDYIICGVLPPNPIELMSVDKTQNLIQKLKTDYDYIILDTPPLAQVSDAYLLLDSADVKIIVTRYNYTIKNVLSFISRDLHNKNVNKVCIVLNDNRISFDQYGYGYGYYNSRKGKRMVRKRKRKLNEFYSK